MLSNVTDSQKTISILPSEVVCEILKHLDSHGLLAVKLTCRSFYNATRSRQFWYQLVELYESMCGGSKMERPREKLTILDLEHWVMRRLRAYESWVLDSPLVFRVRQFQYSPEVKINQAELLPGGRWLLVTTPRFQFFAYDLDSPSIEPQLLFSFGEYNDEDNMHNSHTTSFIWVDPSRETLSFRAAVWGWWGPGAEGRMTKTHIYEATLEESGWRFHSTGAPLYASQTYEDAKAFVAISDKYLAEVWRVRDGVGGFRPVIFVCQYDMVDQGCSSRLEARVELVTTENLYNIHVIDDYIVVAGYALIEVYTVSQIRNLGKQQKLSPLHQLQFTPTSNVVNLIRPFSYQDSLWMVFVTRGDDFRVMRIVPNTSDHPLEATLGHHPRSRGRHSGPIFVNQTAMVHLHGQTINVLAYSWDKDLTECHFHMNRYRLPERDYHWRDLSIAGVDAATGRVVLLCRPQNFYVILDTE